jgi:FkbM family methyltransferase
VLRDYLALCRSLLIYRLRPGHQRRLRNLYQPLVQPGQWVFDVGAHAGDRTACFRKLGARVISIEPQPVFARFLRATNALYSTVTVLSCVLSNSAGPKTLHVNTRNPTVSTLSDRFVQAASSGAPGWEGQQWDRLVDVQARTLDELIAQYGAPAFIKIDVEGAEYDVLCGLSQPVPALSFEFTMIQRELALVCIDRCDALGLNAFNLSLGESHQLAHATWLSADELKHEIAQLPDDANSGDIYARMPLVGSA